jgi:hypothetical protein
MTKRNSPKVMRVRGKVRSLRNNPKVLLIRPITRLASKATPKPCTSNPGTMCATISKLRALTNQWRSKVNIRRCSCVLRNTAASAASGRV